MHWSASIKNSALPEMLAGFNEIPLINRIRLLFKENV
jgi:hypothetical protein